MNKFAKTFENIKHGQILVKLLTGADNPGVEVSCLLGEYDYFIAAVEVRLANAVQARNMFEAIEYHEAESIIDEYKEQINEEVPSLSNESFVDLLVHNVRMRGKEAYSYAPFVSHEINCDITPPPKQPVLSRFFHWLAR